MNKEIMNVVCVGDCYYIVPVFVTDWIQSEPEETDVMEDIPEKIVEYFEIYEEDSSVYINMSTYENDRALILTGYAEMCESMSEVRENLKENNQVMGQEFHYEEY